MPEYFIMRDFGLLDTKIGLMLFYSAMFFPLSFVIQRAFLVSLPYEIEEAAIVDGAGYFTILRSIILPIALPGLVTVGVLVFIFIWNEFFFAQLLTISLGNFNIQLALAQFVTTFERNDAGALGRSNARHDRSDQRVSVPAAIRDRRPNGGVIAVNDAKAGRRTPPQSGNPIRPVGLGTRRSRRRERTLMADIEFSEVMKIYPDGACAVSPFDLAIADGEFMVFVGPSGCGKTTALRMVAGLEEISAGAIRIGDRIVNDVPPKDRDIAMVFQNYALYPHMTRRTRTSAFGLKMRKLDKNEIRRRVTRRGRSSSGSTSSSTASQARSPADSASGSRWAERSSASRKRS